MESFVGLKRKLVTVFNWLVISDNHQRLVYVGKTVFRAIMYVCMGWRRGHGDIVKDWARGQFLHICLPQRVKFQLCVSGWRIRKQKNKNSAFLFLRLFPSYYLSLFLSLLKSFDCVFTPSLISIPKDDYGQLHLQQQQQQQAPIAP